MLTHGFGSLLCLKGEWIYSILNVYQNNLLNTITGNLIAFEYSVLQHWEYLELGMFLAQKKNLGPRINVPATWSI